ncbi:MAG: VOC family protein [Xanthomonadales bacterium]|nr:VOC family protein [Xanthomonadales bacterium]
MKVHLYRVILPVADIEAAARFYGGLLGQPGERVSPGRHYFDCGGTVLACYDPAADGDETGEGWRHHESQYVYFAVPDVEAVRARAKELGARDVTPVAAMPWGETLFYARDPFGNPISFVKQGTEFTGA